MRTLFISDLHLCEQRPDLLRALSQFLRDNQHDCAQLFLLGDIFEAWIGDDAIPAGLQPMLKQLSQMSAAGCAIYFQRGNRDFLVGESLMTAIGATLLPEETVVRLPDGTPALLMHGDQLCLDDTAYQQFRALVRDPAWQQDFLAKPVTERLAIARQLRDASKLQGAMKTETIMDVSPAAVEAAMRRTQTKLLIHGHTHRPQIHRNQRGDGTGTRIVLGDWDKKGWYLECTREGRALIDFPINA